MKKSTEAQAPKAVETAGETKAQNDVKLVSDACYAEVGKLVDQFGFFWVFAGLQNLLTKRLPDFPLKNSGERKLWNRIWIVHEGMAKLDKKINKLPLNWGRKDK
jgi:hypothetical protein